MAEVVSLSGEPVKPEVDYDRGLVDLLEHAIQGVKIGEVRGVGLILVRVGEPTDIDTSYQGRRLELLAGAYRLAHHINLQQDEHNASKP